MTKRKRTSILISLAILAIIIVVFPLISLKYLNKGLEFRRSHLGTLEELGSLPEFSATNFDGKTMSSDIAQGKVTVFSHEDLACLSDNATTLHEFVDKFINQDDFRHVILMDAGCPGWDESYRANIEDNKELSEQFYALIPDTKTTSFVFLADRKGEVRRVYDLSKTGDIEALVTHTTLLLPPLKKRG